MDQLDIKYKQQQQKKQQVINYVNNIVSNKTRFNDADVDEARNKLVTFLEQNNYDPDVIDAMSQHLNKLACNLNLFANMISADTRWLDVCLNRNLLTLFPGTYEEVVNKYGIRG